MKTLYDYVKSVLDLNEEFIRTNNNDQAILMGKVNDGLTKENRDDVTMRIGDLMNRTRFTEKILDVVKETYEEMTY